MTPNLVTFFRKADLEQRGIGGFTDIHDMGAAGMVTLRNIGQLSHSYGPSLFIGIIQAVDLTPAPS